MNRILRWLAAVGLTGLIFVGCGIQPPPPEDRDDDDDDDTGACQGHMCGAVCTNLGFDPANCGNCGVVCAPGMACQGGQCLCAPGLLKCGTSCINPVSDRNNCGNCGVVCPTNLPYCSNQACSATCNGTVCPATGACVNLASDQANCGACGNICPGGSVCASGVCSCPAGTQQCGSACVPQGTCNIGTGGTTGTGGTSGIGGTPPAGGVSGFGGTGGVSNGGNAGSSMGGTPTGGMSGAGPTGGMGGMITGTPPGWWTHGTWHGCAWTGVDTVAGTTTMNTPRDFTMHQAGTGYCLQGTVHNTYESVSLMGFNLNETPTGSATQCAFNPASATMMGPPGVQLTGTGLAINFTKSTAATLRVQIQGPNGATMESDRWCYTITPAAGPVFAPFAMFNTKCWDGTGTNYSGQPISAVAFLVPGALSPTPFNYCVTGFAAGSAASDAPTWGTGTSGPLMGTIGGGPAMDLDFQRVKVAAGGKSYIIQNNNWGNPGGSDQLITYRDNSFTITSSNGNGSQAPASFPSVYIGANGDTQNGTFSTTSDDHLPKQISAITSVQSTFRHTGTSGQLNAAYDIWFSASVPTARYNDAISGFVMLWLYDPSNFQPIGSVQRSNVMIGGRAWNVWVGPRGGSGSNSNAPVVSYVATSTSTSFSGDLKPFFTDAAQHGIQSSWYLTDVFAGFECWSGADCTGKQVQEFTAVVAP
jgi:hypothetical protein